jgi:hypothetical protein
MTILAGITSISDNAAELNKRSFAASILRLFPNGSAPMFALTSQGGRSVATSSTHGYFSKTWTSVTTLVNGAHANPATTTITVDSNEGMVVGHVLHNLMTRENLLITDIPAGTTTVTVTRAFGRVVATAIGDNDKLIAFATSHVEGSLRPASRSISMTYTANYTQIFRNAWSTTGTAMACQLEMGVDNIAENKKDCAMFHSSDIEGAIIFGQPKMTTGSNGKPLHATQGVWDSIEHYAASNTNAAGATTTYDQLVALLEPAFLYSTDMSNPTSRVMFCDNTANKVINQIGKLSGQLQFNVGENSFGMRFSKFRFYKGDLTIVDHPLLNSYGLTGTAIVMDMPALKLAYLKGRDTVKAEYGMDGRAVPMGEDAAGGDFLTELAVELINPYSCAMITGLTAGAA